MPATEAKKLVRSQLSQSRTLWEWISIGSILGILGLMVAGVMFISSTTVSGEEFSPDFFQTRDFSFYRFPGTSWNFSSTSLGTSKSPSSNPVLNHLKTSGASSAPWQVVKVRQGSISETRGPAILIEYLEQRNADGNNFWDAWSSVHPKLAIVLWPKVQEAARRDLYECMPELFQIAQSGIDSDNLAKLATKEILKIAVLRTRVNPALPSDATQVDWGSWSKDFAKDYAEDVEITHLLSQFKSN